MDTKKSAARAAKEVRTSTTRNVERSQILTKTSAPPPALAAKKRDRSSIPPPLADNDNAPKRASVAPISKAPVPIGRGRLPTGSLHTEARVPAQAETIKQRLTALVNTQQKLGELKRSSQKNFYQIGELLHRVREQRLYEVKGYGSFEAFIERELNLGPQFCLQCVRIYETFLPEAAANIGFAKLVAALEAIGGVTATVAPQVPDSAKNARSPIPPHKL